MFPIVVVARELSKEETDERARRWKMIFWLLLLPFFWQVVDAIFYAYRGVNWPYWFRFAAPLVVPALMSWLLVRYFKLLVFCIAAVLFIYLAVGGVAWLWRITTS